MYPEDINGLKGAMVMEKACKYIFFDCMETLIDLYKLPAMRDYAAWAYEGSGIEDYWKDLDEFFRYYLLSKQELASRLPENADYEMRGRFSHLVRLSLPQLPYELVEPTTDILYNNYWKNYKSGSYVKEDVRRALPVLKAKYRLGVVSNFMVMGGIEEMLEMHGIRRYFDFVVTSVAEGWRKPHRAIYQKALSLAGVGPEQVIFVGDDYINDYITPLELGMCPILLDRFGRYPELGGLRELSPYKQGSRICDFDELVALLSG